MKKILYCEDDKFCADAFSKGFSRIGYEVFTLLSRPSEIKDKVNQTIKDFNPDMIIIDSLEGLCFSTIEIALDTDTKIIPIVFSGKDSILEEAKSKNYLAYNKDDWMGLYEYLEKLK